MSLVHPAPLPPRTLADCGRRMEGGREGGPAGEGEREGEQEREREGEIERE